ncbi:hypothetical protein C2G38_2224478 [Gigaspora rosea]|uniref:Uncharacterized protein n=1 Tax=Gigaspora rosea TaxID=44941 RepID=A0A397U047_9GLOM|nr:hypothetical protein C2G38_2224478 [Gigaspora rosea]
MLYVHPFQLQFRYYKFPILNVPIAFPFWQIFYSNHLAFILFNPDAVLIIPSEFEKFSARMTACILDRQYEYSFGSNYLLACKQCQSMGGNIGPSGLGWTYCHDCEGKRDHGIKPI